MLTGPEAHSGIKSQHDLTFRGIKFFPGGLYRQTVGNDDRFEMDLPGFRPIFLPQFRAFHIAEFDPEFPPVFHFVFQKCGGVICIFHTLKIQGVVYHFAFFVAP